MSTSNGDGGPGATQKTPTPQAGDTGAAGPAAGSDVTPHVPDKQKTEVADLPEDIRSLIAELRKENAAHRNRAKEAEEAVKKAAEAQAIQQGEFKALYEKAKADLDAAKAEIAAIRRNGIAARLGAKYKLPEKLAARLQGETEEEMEADAKALATSIPAVPAPDTERGERTKRVAKPVDRDETYVFQRPGDVKRTLRREE